jgi:hypothetical protein
MRTALMRPPHSRRCIPSLRCRLALLAAAVLAAPAPAQQISSHVIASGGGASASPGGCLLLEGSMGQPAVGTASGGVYTVRAGYWAGPGSQRRDSIFSGDFEECT